MRLCGVLYALLRGHMFFASLLLRTSMERVSSSIYGSPTKTRVLPSAFWCTRHGKPFVHRMQTVIRGSCASAKISRLPRIRGRQREVRHSIQPLSRRARPNLLNTLRSEQTLLVLGKTPYPHKSSEDNHLLELRRRWHTGST